MNQVDYVLVTLSLIVVSASILYTHFLAIQVVWAVMICSLCVYGGSMTFALIASIRIFEKPNQIHSLNVLTVPIIYIIRSKFAIIVSRTKRLQSHKRDNI
ncbi:MAG: hypothetical protein ACFFE2_16220 [Candidatus Thorarchaeota archaeon]